MKTDFLIEKETFSYNNPISDKQDFRLHFIGGQCAEEAHISNFYFVVYIRSGKGKIQYELHEYSFASPCLIFFSPFHPFRLIADEEPEGLMLQFSSEFYWMDQGKTHDKDLCELFRNVSLPIFSLNDQDVFILDNLFQCIIREFEWFQQPDRKMLCSYLKSVLIHSLRILSGLTKDKGERQKNLPKDYQLLKNLHCLIHNNFRTLKRPADYADLLNITTSALTKATRKYYGTTVTDLIQEHILEEARKELAFSGKSVKEIAISLGYEDPYYFSRLFKKIAGLSPDLYKQQVVRFLSA